MSTQEIKSSILNAVEKINNEQILNELLSVVKTYNEESKSLLSSEQKMELDKRWEEYEKREGTSFSAHDVINELKSKFTK